MTCSIAITAIAGIGPGPSVVSVQGTVGDCAPDLDGGQVRVSLACGNPSTAVATRAATVFTDGTWNVVFPDVGQRCPCGGPIVITANCLTDETCRATFTGSLECVTCPILFGTEDDVGAPTFEAECEPDGTATVTISVLVQNPTGTLIHVAFDCGIDAIDPNGGTTAFPTGSTGPAIGRCRYPTPGTPAPARARILDADFQATGCPPLVLPLPALEPCQPGCAVIRRIDVEIEPQCEQDSDGKMKRRVHFTPTVDGPIPTSHVWTFGDDSDPELSVGSPTSIDHLYEIQPTFQPKLCIVGPGGCLQRCKSVLLEELDFVPCECPQVLRVEVAFGDCPEDPLDGMIKRAVTFTPSVSGPSSTAHIWTFGDGADSGVISGVLEPITHLYVAPPTTSPELELSGPTGCANTTFAVPLDRFALFEPCRPGEPPEEEEEGESTGCAGLRIAAGLLFALSILLGLFAFCLPALAVELGIAAAVAAAIASILLAIYFFCPSKPCNWFLRLSGQALLAAGVVAVVFSACCTTLVGPGIGLILLGIVALATWAMRCGISRCGFLKEITVVLGGVVLPVAGAFAVVAGLIGLGLSTCFSGLALAFITAIFGPIAAAAAICED